MSRSRNDGKYLEDAVYIEFSKELSMDFMWRRLYDTQTAGKGLPPQPADFDICYQGYSAHLESKTSGEKTKSLKSFSQYADMRRWSMAGKPGYVLLHLYYFDELFLFDVSRLDPELKSWPATLALRINHINQLTETLKGLLCQKFL